MWGLVDRSHGVNYQKFVHRQACVSETMSGHSLFWAWNTDWWHLRWQLFIQAAPLNLFQQWIKWIWKPSISITKSSVQHVSVYIICDRNISLSFVLLAWGLSLFNMHVCVCFFVLWELCTLWSINPLHVFACVCTSRCWSEQRHKKVDKRTDSNRWSRCPGAYRFPFSLTPHLKNQRMTLESASRLQRSSEGTPPYKSDIQTLIHADPRRSLLLSVFAVCVYALYLFVCRRCGEECPGEPRILSVCDSERDNAASGCQANCHLCRAAALFISSLLKIRSSSPSLFIRRSVSLCILCSVLLSYSPFRRQVTYKPSVTMATPICIWKSAFEGTNKMCNSMLWHCA